MNRHDGLQINPRKKQKNRILSKENDQHYVSSIISDEEALRIHGISSWYDKNDCASDSDSGKSSFDEEFLKNKPQPIRISRRNIVTIKPLNVMNGQPQTESKYSHTETEKGIAYLN